MHFDFCCVKTHFAYQVCVLRSVFLLLFSLNVVLLGEQFLWHIHAVLTAIFLNMSFVYEKKPGATIRWKLKTFFFGFNKQKSCRRILRRAFNPKSPTTCYDNCKRQNEQNKKLQQLIGNGRLRYFLVMLVSDAKFSRNKSFFWWCSDHTSQKDWNAAGLSARWLPLKHCRFFTLFW